MLPGLYGNNIVTMVGFAEEALPFLDIVPTATIGWALKYSHIGRGMWVLDWLRRGRIFGSPNTRGRQRNGRTRRADFSGNDAGSSGGQGYGAREAAQEEFADEQPGFGTHPGFGAATEETRRWGW